MTVSETVADSFGEIVDSIELPALLHDIHIEPRCRICRNDRVRKKINDMLATGLSYAMILRATADDNAKLEKPDRVTIDSIRNHTARHFPVQNVAQATYRRILERRAQENGVDFVNAVATAITPMAFYETVMVKGYATLVDPDTHVDVNTGMIAAGRLQALIESRASGTCMAEMMAQLDRIIRAIHDSVPEELWDEILHKIDGPVLADRPKDEFEECDGAEDMYDGMESAEADEDCWTATARRHSPEEARRAPTRTIEGPSSAIRKFTPKTIKDEDDI
jgi:hypothetical protein